MFGLTAPIKLVGTIKPINRVQITKKVDYWIWKICIPLLHLPLDKSLFFCGKMPELLLLLIIMQTMKEYVPLSKSLSSTHAWLLMLFFSPFFLDEVWPMPKESFQLNVVLWTNANACYLLLLLLHKEYRNIHITDLLLLHISWFCDFCLSFICIRAPGLFLKRKI